MLAVKKIKYRVVFLLAISLLIVFSATPSAFAAYSSISLNIYPAEPFSGEYINIYGYVEPTEGTPYVHIYVDNKYIGLISADRNGYYSKQIRIIDEGARKITVRLNNIERTKYVYVKQALPINGIDIAAPLICITSCEKTAVTETISERGNHSFVTVDVSANEVDVNRYEGNTVSIKVTNNLGRSELFSVDTDFDKSMVFAPHEEIITDGRSKMFHIYFSPKSKEGRLSGTIYIRQDNKTIKSVPITLFIAKNQYDAGSRKDIIPVSSAFIGILLLSIAFATVIIIALARKYTAYKPRPLDLSQIPKPVSPRIYALRKDIIGGSSGPTNVKKDDIFVSDWSHIKY